uniref:hypothetical protein n=1 Tax=Herbidospora sakaeratensis TaxID=564415 RepID=UPI0012F8F366|nr:hypothetical protein [Herbidospora sakaeratensis]
MRFLRAPSDDFPVPSIAFRFRPTPDEADPFEFLSGVVVVTDFFGIPAVDSVVLFPVVGVSFFGFAFAFFCFRLKLKAGLRLDRAERQDQADVGQGLAVAVDGERRLLGGQVRDAEHGPVVDDLAPVGRPVADVQADVLEHVRRQRHDQVAACEGLPLGRELSGKVDEPGRGAGLALRRAPRGIRCAG